ncbi:hypothetical protein Pelsub_P1141 [Pelolinea submarina]|nr:hypothetical protein Pelsub_P1141 [Pelolinea submarina]
MAGSEISWVLIEAYTPQITKENTINAQLHLIPFSLIRNSISSILLIDNLSNV